MPLCRALSSSSNSSEASSGGSRAARSERVRSAVSAIRLKSAAISAFDWLPAVAEPMSVLILLSRLTAAL